MKRSYLIVGIVLLVLFLDQALKIWVKTNMEYGEYFNLLGFDWAQIHFVENNGMAFGLSMVESIGKIVLGVFLGMVLLFLGYYFCLLYTSPSPRDATLSRMPSSA